MRVALAQVNPTVGDFTGNASRMVRAARDAAAAGAEVVVFPELSLTGYPPRDLVEKPSFIERSERELERLAAETADLDLAIVAGYVARSQAETGKRALNCAAVLERGRLAFRQTKMLLPNYDVFDEARYFRPAEKEDLCTLRGRPVALTICEDAWNDRRFFTERLYQRDPVEELFAAGAGMMICINASPFNMGKRAVRRGIYRSAARRYGKPVVYVNQVGGNDQLVFDGSSFAMSAEGEVIAAARSFEEDLVIADFATAAGQDFPADYPRDYKDECEAVYQALVLGTRDYIHKCGFSRVILGLSGGIDSSLTAAIAVEAVGKENVTGVGMPGPYSSGHSVTDAREMAERLGIRFDLVSISSVYDRFLDELAPLFAGRVPDVAEENLQSRLRGVTLMALSNKTGALVLTTGNKSELAVGYCTLYGDMCGGLAVISDVPKTMVYSLARIANRRHDGAIPESVFTKAPSAELRPNQKDTDSLPEYSVLDPILEEYIEQMRTPRQIAERRGVPLKLVQEIVNKVDRNEYKRQQAAPGIKVTTKAFGIGRRVPIAQKFSE
ncbi:MAG TPA: NAD+ synthase [Bryobacteraceae bacterium]|jgi:NAD+ synthase/NAD+ synthase (glutamine-hydrolysing)